MSVEDPTAASDPNAALQCSVCTFLNKPKWLACEVCGTPKGAENRIGEVALDLDEMATTVSSGTATPEELRVVAERLTQASLLLDSIEVPDSDVRDRRRAQLRRIDGMEAWVKTLRSGGTAGAPSS